MPTMARRAMTMADPRTGHSPDPVPWRDPVWATLAGCFILLVLFDFSQLIPTVQFSTGALLGTAPFILFVVTAVGVLKATSAETLIAQAFVGGEIRIIVFATFLGGRVAFLLLRSDPFYRSPAGAGHPAQCGDGVLADLTTDGFNHVSDHLRHTWMGFRHGQGHNNYGDGCVWWFGDHGTVGVCAAAEPLAGSLTPIGCCGEVTHPFKDALCGGSGASQSAAIPSSPHSPAMVCFY